MWEDLRGELLRLGILPEGVCPPPGRIFVRADVDQRTRATARALLDGLAPGCNRGYAVADTDPDPLFHPVKSGLYAFDPAQVAGEVLRMADGDLNQLRQEQNEALIQLEALSAPVSAEFCARFNLSPNCGLADIPNFVSVAAGGNGVKLAARSSQPGRNFFAGIRPVARKQRRLGPGGRPDPAPTAAPACAGL